MRELGWLRAPLLLTYAFLFLPIVVLIVMSFNAGSSPYTWSGWSLQWYGQLAGDERIMEGLRNTLVVALGSTVLSTVLGTMLAVGLHRHSRSALLDAFSLAPAIVPDIILGIGLLSLFSLSSIATGLHTVLIAHTVFGLAFVAAVVKARLSNTDPQLEEASRDLGAGPVTTFLRITVPTLRPAILAGALLVFTLSLDEFVIAFFTDGPSTPTLPIVIYSMVRFGVTPEINALATVLIGISCVTVLVVQRLLRVKDRA
ncbi:MAG: ABC transporter permease [Intrasporangium sp.]|uniref:ABC transporter permease n=1 Tax=Intrasporangium sp. TaxID=1925024 RepID=UPI003F81A9C8